jgi:hypothetical protein
MRPKSVLTKFGMCSAILAILVLASGTAAGTTHKVPYQFKGGADGSTPKGPLVLDAAGNLYGTTARGGTSPNCYDSGSRHIGCGPAQIPHSVPMAPAWLPAQQGNSGNPHLVVSMA